MWKLYENSMKTEYCYAVRNRPFWRTGKYASICDEQSIKALISDDYRDGVISWLKGSVCFVLKFVLPPFSPQGYHLLPDLSDACTEYAT